MYTVYYIYVCVSLSLWCTDKTDVLHKIYHAEDQQSWLLQDRMLMCPSCKDNWVCKANPSDQSLEGYASYASYATTP